MQMAEAMADLLDVVDKVRDLTAWLGEIGPANLEASADFMVAAGQGQAFNDTVAQINADLVAFMGTNREKIGRLARGS
jgi:hypothetical protein